MRLEGASVLVVVIALDGAGGTQRPGLEDHDPGAVAHRQVQPDATGRIGGRQLMTAEILDRNSGVETTVADFQVTKGHPRRFRLQVGNRAVHGGAHFLRLSRHGQVVAKSVQQPLHEEIAADEGMPRNARTALAQHRGNWRVLLHLGHVAGLTTARFLVFAVQPLLIRDLFGELADHVALRVESLRQQRVARGAQFRGTHVLAFGRPERRRRPHDRRASFVDLERAVDMALPGQRLLVDLEAANEAVASAQILIRDLVAHRAGHTVVRQSIVQRIQVGREMRKRIPVAARKPGFVSHHRHVADGAFVLDVRGCHWMIERLTPHGGHPVGVAGGIRHHTGPPVGADRNILAGRGRHAVVARDAPVRCLEVCAVCPARGDLDDGAVSRRRRLLRIRARHQDDDDRQHQRQKRAQRSQHARLHYQPCRRLPSTQSHSV